MGNGILKETTSLKQLALVAFSGLALILSACTKERSPEIADEQLAEKIFSIEELKNAQINLETGASSTAPKGNSMSLAGQGNRVMVTSSAGDERLAKLFKNIVISGQSNSVYPVRVTVDKDNVNFHKVVADPTELTALEKQIVRKVNGRTQVLFMQAKIESYGVIRRAKDDNKEETSNLELVPTDFESATHIQLSLNADSICTVGQCASTRKAMEEVFERDALLGKVTTLTELKDTLKLTLVGYEDSKVVTMATPSRDVNMTLHVFKIMKKADLEDEDLIAELRRGESARIRSCPKEVKAQLPAEEQADCVMVLAYKVPARNVSVELQESDDFGLPTSRVNFKETSNPQATSFIRVSENTSPEAVLNVGVSQVNVINMADIRGKEFQMRRTFEDGSASIMVFGPGASGELDIVKFEFEKNRLVVRRADAINGDSKPSTVDREELLSLKASYVKRVAGSDPLDPKYEETIPSRAERVIVDWSGNSIPLINSPLSFFGAGQCFMSTGNTNITNADNRMKEGILNFSLNSTITFVPECMSWYGMNDYWYGGALQGTFNIVERVSFRVHTGELDNKPATDIPFRAQHQLGFGIFTTGKIKPDDFGNTGRVGTERALPVIHDFSDGKVLTYHLGGLPASGWMRNALIEGTKEVVEDWNIALKKSFAGTSLERSTPYVVLKIDGIDAEPGRLGDLDRNYIWNFEKNLDSGLLGMSQAAPNPRSGRIEQNNVLMYSGNVLSSIGFMKEMARVKKEYQDMKDAVLAQIPADASDEVLPGDPEGAIIITDDGIEEKSAAQPQGPKPQTLKEASKQLAQTMIQRWNSLAQVMAPRTPSLNQNRLKPTADKKDLIRTQVSLRQNQSLTDRKKKASAQLSEISYLNRIFQKAIEMESTKDLTQLQALSATEVLKAYGSKLSKEQRRILALQSHRLAMMAEFEKNFRKGPNCALVVNKLSADPDILTQPVEVTFKDYYKSTLAHEIGHSLGLTHNFQGSFDKRNFAFKGENASAPKARNYSSVMDYIPDDHINYKGPGPYDVRAIRVAYTGLIEADPSVVKVTPDKKKVVAVQDGQGNVKGFVPANDQGEISLDQFRQATLGSESWWRLDASFWSKLPIKQYSFCTDIDVGGEPTCNRWDVGTSAPEIAKFYSDEYKNLYPVLNSRGSRINIRSLDSYIGRLFYQMFQMRFFMDETFYLAIQGASQDQFVPMAIGAIESMKTYVETLSTPTALLPYEDINRFALHKYEYIVHDEEGNPVVGQDGQPQKKTAHTLVESKPIQDLLIPGVDAVQTRGIEFDKAIAMMMLTERRLGHPRYESISLAVSFAEFEKYLLGAETPEQSMVLSSLQGILEDNPTALAITPTGLIALPPEFKPETSEIVRYYSILGANILLNADTLEDKDNFAALFRTINSKKAIGNRLMVTKLDQSLSSPTSTKYLALDNATVAGNIVRNAAQKRVYIENSAKLGDLVLKALEAKATNKPDVEAQVTAELAKVLKDLNKREVLVSAAEAKQGITEEVLAQFTVRSAAETLAQAQFIHQLAEAQGIPVDMYPQLMPLLLGDLRKATEAQTKQLPMMAVGQKALLKSLEKDKVLGPILGAFINDSVLEVNHGVVVNNLGVMNQMYYLMFPEQN
ncbi:MAG: zinc-dependent metalloprotease [Proteobacteria bacterium]|jgi:predicted Zn-dependent protease|nr:zinc-dependent metalloprotease [Pseudomonadota bacterium]